MTARSDIPAVLALGLDVHPFVAGAPQAVPLTPAGADLKAMADALAKALAQHGAVVAIVPARLAAGADRALHAARALLDARRVAVHLTTLPPLAASVLAALAAALAPLAPAPGLLASALPALEGELLVVTWLGSVANLRAPAPTVVQHASSLLPGSAFAACSWPQPAVARIRRGALPFALPEIPWPMSMALAPASGDEAWLRERVRAALAPERIVSVPASASGPAWWGTGRVVEAVAYPEDVGAVAARVARRQRARRCRWCGEPVAGTACPFCGMAVMQPKAEDPEPAEAPR